MAKTTLDQTDKKMSPGGANTPRMDMNKFIEMASESEQEEKLMQDYQDMKYEMDLKDYLKNNPGKTEDDFQIEVIGINLAGLSRKTLIDMLKNEYPRQYRLYEPNIDKYKTKDIKKLLDNLDGKDRVPFGSGGSSNGVSSMKRADFLKLPFSQRVEKMFGVSLKGDEKLSEIQLKIQDLEPMLILED
jgi:hypothetical protein